MAQQQSKLPSGQGLSRELIAYHQSNEDRLTRLESGGTVSSIGGATGAITLGNGLEISGQELSAALSSSSAALSGDVALNDTSNYFDGPSLSLAAGTWLVIATVTLIDTGATAKIDSKLWDGTNVYASVEGVNNNTSRAFSSTMSAIITLGSTTTIKVSCRDFDATTGKILFNQTGNSKDSHITAVLIA